ncbi:hypothetical protein AB0J86_20325 [Micromonospora sp. NPDC049559]|uniref:hypothetical protein n=1 Tax=Micromonospora sp. NPDC049559 TaxID=3155923 RepID=UPI00342108C5
MSDPSASIDDLLRYEEEPPRARGGATGPRWWLRTVLAAAALTVVTVFGLRLFGVALPVPAIAAGALALLALRRFTAQVAPPPPARRRAYRNPDREDGTYRWGAQDALRGAVKRWEKALGRAHGDRDWCNENLRPMLGELADERLRQRHGLTRASDPGRARELLGEPLWNFLSTPVRRTPPPRELAAIVAPLEKL